MKTAYRKQEGKGIESDHSCFALRWLPRWPSWLRILPPMQELQARPLGWEDLLEKETKPTPAFLLEKVPWTEQAGRLHTVLGEAESGTTEHTHSCFATGTLRKKK